MNEFGAFLYFHQFKIAMKHFSSVPNSFTIGTLNRFFYLAVSLGIALSGIVSHNASAQFWFEDFGFDFDFCETADNPANGTVTPNGQWEVMDTGVNSALANAWFIGSGEGGQPAGSCSNGCGTFFGIERSLYVGRFQDNEGAIYFEVPAPGASETDRRAMSPVIDCSGQWTIELSFNYIHSNTVTTDFCSVDYFDGAVWEQLAVLPNSPNGCAPFRQWDNFTVALPPSANNNPDVRIGFRWRNNSDGNTNGGNLGHSVAVDELTLFSGPPPALPVANFSANTTSLCEGNLVTFSAEPTFDPTFSTGEVDATYTWNFPGGSPATANSSNPVILYETPGLYNVTLTVTDNIGSSAPFTINAYIEVLECGPAINIGVNQNVACANEECFDLTDLSTGNGIFSWLWTITSPSGVETVSTEQNPSNICLTEIGMYSVRLDAADLDGNSTRNYPNFLQVIDCTGPDVDFSVSRTVVCPGECIQLTDLSTSNFPIFAWQWTLPGGQAEGESLAGSSTQQNPLVCYANPGVYSITLAAQDQEGVSAITKTIQITVDPCTGPPSAGINASARTICTGDCVDFFSESLGLVDDYLWVFQGVTDLNSAISNERNPSVVCYTNPGTFNVTLTVSNSFGQVDSRVFSNYITVEQCINPPVPRISAVPDTVCAGKCVQFQSVSTGFGITAVEWNFQGGTPTTSTSPNPEVCYNVPGSYAVSLKVTGAGGDSTRVFTNAVTVVNDLSCRPQFTVSIPDTICAGDCANFAGSFTDADEINWTFVGGNPETSQASSPGIVCYNQVGTFPVIVEASNTSGAASPIVRNVVVLPRPGLNAGPDITVNAGTAVTLNATIMGVPNPTGNFTWQPFDLVDNFRNASVNTVPRETTTYIVRYKEQGGCTTVDSVTVFVNFVSAVGVPNSFSPNGDGVNDQLKVLGQGIANLDLRVFNRYGQLVFRTTDQSIGWDGTHNGKALNPATFVWVLDVRFAEGRQERFTGDVTLVR